MRSRMTSSEKVLITKCTGSALTALSFPFITWQTGINTRMRNVSVGRCRRRSPSAIINAGNGKIRWKCVCDALEIRSPTIRQNFHEFSVAVCLYVWVQVPDERKEGAIMRTPVRDSLNRVKSDYTENYHYGSPFTVIFTNDESFRYICATWMMLIAINCAC